MRRCGVGPRLKTTRACTGVGSSGQRAIISAGQETKSRRLPPSREARPASTDSAADTLNTTIRPLWNGPDSSDGKNVRPVSAAWLAAGSRVRTPDGASRCCIGFLCHVTGVSSVTGVTPPYDFAAAAGFTPCGGMLRRSLVLMIALSASVGRLRGG